MTKKIYFFIVSVCIASTLFAQEKADALKLYRNGRDLEAIGRINDANKMYNEAIDVCKDDLIVNSKNMDAYTVYAWALNRLQEHQKTVDLCKEALKITSDYRVIEIMAESYFYLDNYSESLKNMEKYIDLAPRGERISVAYFFVGEIFRLTGKPNKADIAYSAAVHLEPGLSLWWYRLGLVREELGEKKSASQAFERALRLRPDYKEATDGLNRVRT